MEEELSPLSPATTSTCSADQHSCLGNTVECLRQDDVALRRRACRCVRECVCSSPPPPLSPAPVRVCRMHVMDMKNTRTLKTPRRRLQGVFLRCRESFIAAIKEAGRGREGAATQRHSVAAG